MIYLVHAMPAGLQNAKLLGFGPIRLCTDNVVRFVQMLQYFDIFAFLENLAACPVFLLILLDLHEASSDAVVSREYMILALSTSTVTCTNSALAWALREF
jgi:hypothetical protein